MLLRSRDVSGILQSNIALSKGLGLVRSNAEALANAMNRLHPGGSWRGASLDVFTNPQGTFNALSNRGPFLTSMKSFGSDLHMVVIDGLDDAGRIVVRDPWGKGTRYTMDWSDFTNHWMGDTVYWGGK
jgi:hypothetical protein